MEEIVVSLCSDPRNSTHKYLDVVLSVKMAIGEGCRVAVTSWRAVLTGLSLRPVGYLVRMTSPSLARRRCLLNEMYNVMWRPAWMPCR